MLEENSSRDVNGNSLFNEDLFRKAARSFQ
jgi:hypothetical protein